MEQDIWILEGAQVPVTFDTKGYVLYKGCTGVVGLPMEAYLRLVLVKGEAKIELANASKLKGRVIIKNSEEALEFARLITSIDTHYLFPDIDYIEPQEGNNAEIIGTYSKEYGKRLGLRPTNASSEGAVYRIERNLVDKSQRLYRTTESVGKDGAYSITKLDLIDEKSPVIFPVYQ